MNQTTLIPRRVLFGNPDRMSPQISWDGTRLAYLAPVNGVLNVWVGPIEKPEAAVPVTDDKHRGIHIFVWAYDNDHILYIQDRDGDENWHVYAVDVKEKQTHDLTPLNEIQARIMQLSDEFPHEVMIGINDRNNQLHDVYRTHIVTGERELKFQNDGFVDFTIDNQFRIRLAMTFTPEGTVDFYRLDDRGELTQYMSIPAEDTLTTSPLGFDKTGRNLYLVDSRSHNTSALVSLDIESSEQRVLSSNDRADVSGCMVHPTDHTIEAVAYTYARRQWDILDDGIRNDLDVLGKITDGEIDVISRSLDNRQWIVCFSVDNGPRRYYHYNRDSKESRFLFTDYSALEEASLSRMLPVAIKARDGLELVSYYTVPHGADKNEQGVPEKQLPLVLLVHGGPWARDNWGYDAEHQWLANRGYAVLSVNYRGSTGFGKDFINAADREWARKMHDDLIDAVKWAIDQKIADPKRVAIMGGSYGGYSTLVGLTFTPDTFACGVDIVGPSNLMTLIENVPPYWIPILPLLTNRIGDPTTEDGQQLLQERSPLTYADRIVRPLLIGQGANDPRVKQSESDQIIQAMKEKSIPVTYALFSDEGHGFLRPENRLAFYAVVESFLKEHLGGECEPIGEDFEGSTISIPEGAGLIPGLDDQCSQKIYQRTRHKHESEAD